MLLVYFRIEKFMSCSYTAVGRLMGYCGHYRLSSSDSDQVPPPCRPASLASDLQYLTGLSLLSPLYLYPAVVPVSNLGYLYVCLLRHGDMLALLLTDLWEVYITPSQPADQTGQAVP